MKLGLIIGCARSGTSILGELVGAHEQVNYIYEAHEAWEIGGLGANDSHRLTERHANPEVIDAVRTWFAARDDGRMIVEKCPRNSLRVPYIKKIFPEARIIHIIRDGRDVACSLLPGIGGTEWRHLKPENWRELQKLPPIERCARTWLEAISIAESDLQGTDHLRVIYEDLVERPGDVAGKVLRFLGLPPSPKVAAFCRKIQDETEASYLPKGKSRQWNTEDHSRRVGRWRENLSSADQRRVQEILSAALPKFGYALADLPETPC